MNLRLFMPMLLLLACTQAARAEEKPPQTFVHRITGLCYPERVEDLREVIKKQPKATLVSVDYEHASATFTYNPKEISTESLGHVLGAKGFGIKAPLTTPVEKLTNIDIQVVGLDCKGCCLGTYNAIYKIDGVEQATVNLKEGHVLALIDPAKTNREALEAALKKANVQLKTPEPEKPKEPAK